MRRTYRAELAQTLEDKRHASLIGLLVAIGQGLVGEAFADPDWDHRRAVECAVDCVRELLMPARADHQQL